MKDSLIQPYTNETATDRAALTVRICSDGRREWLDPSGKIALVFFEKDCWWARQSDQHECKQFICEIDALDYLLLDRLTDIRTAAFAQAHKN